MVLSARNLSGLPGKIGVVFFINAVLSLSLFAQSGESAHEKASEARKIRCASSQNPLCEEIEEVSDLINQGSKLVSTGKRPDLGLLYSERGRLYFESRLYKRAFIDFNRAESEYGFRLAIMDRAHIYMMRGEFNAAVSEYNGVLNREPQNPYALEGRGNAYFRQRKFDLALNDYNDALDINHRLAEAYFGRGVIFLQRGVTYLEAGDETLGRRALRSAVKDLESVVEIKLNDTSAETYRMLARTYQALGDEALSRKNREKAEEIGDKVAVSDAEDDN